MPTRHATAKRSDQFDRVNDCSKSSTSETGLEPETSTTRETLVVHLPCPTLALRATRFPVWQLPWGLAALWNAWMMIAEDGIFDMSA